jgi:hypothetical protein
MKTFKQYFLTESIKRFYNLNEIIEQCNSKMPEINIQEYKGSTKKWNNPNVIPFDYGEFPNCINPADNMGWDFIIEPNSKYSKDLKLIGIIKIKDNANQIPHPNGNKKGNDKLILSNNGIIDNNSIQILKNYFNEIPWFENILIFNQNEINPINIKERKTWESETFKDIKLSHVNNGTFGGIAVGSVVKRSF